MAIEKCPAKVLTIDVESFTSGLNQRLEVRMSLASIIKNNCLPVYGSVVLIEEGSQ